MGGEKGEGGLEVHIRMLLLPISSHLPTLHLHFSSISLMTINTYTYHRLRKEDAMY